MWHLIMSNSILQYMQLGMIERKTGILMAPQIYHYLSLMGYFPGENFGPYRKKYEKKKKRRKKYEQQRHPVNRTNMGCLDVPCTGLNVGRNTESERETVLAWAVITNYHRLVA